MPYPRFLNLSEEVQSKLKNFLNQEVFNLQSERGRYLELLKDYQKIYWAEPKEGKNTFPFSGASKLIVPLAAISIETIHARNMTTMFGLPQLISCKAQLPEYVGIENKFGTWLDKDLKYGGNIKNFVKNSDLERVKYGNCIGRASYVYETKTAVKEVGGEESEFTVVVRNGAVAECVPVSRFLMPYTDTDPQKARLVGEEFEKTEYELQVMEESSYFFPGTVEKIKSYFQNPGSGTNTGASFERNQQDLEHKTPVPFPNTIQYQRFELAFNTDEDPDGRMKEIIVDYHYESNTLMSVRYNWYEDLHRSYRIGHYFPIEHRWTGVGVCKQLIEFQKEITVQHRQRIDNATLANTRMIKINKLSGYGSKEPIFPGKMWFVDEMDHIDVLQMGEVYNSAFNNEQSSLMYAQQRSGIDELSLGQQQTGTPDTATGSITRVQEARGKQGYFFNNLKDFVQDIILDYACVLHQYGPRDLEIIDRHPDGQIIKSILQLPEAAIKEGLIFELKVVGQTDNKSADAQKWLQTSQMLQQYWQGMLGLATQVGAPQLMGMIVLRAISSGTEAMRQILEAQDVKNIERLILMESVTNGLNQLLEQGGNQRPTGPQQSTGNIQPSQTIPPNTPTARI